MSVRIGNGTFDCDLSSATNFCRSGIMATICPPLANNSLCASPSALILLRHNFPEQIELRHTADYFVGLNRHGAESEQLRSNQSQHQHSLPKPARSTKPASRLQCVSQKYR